MWIIDPLDGTVNYFHGIPQFCTSIACYKGVARSMLAAKDYSKILESGMPVSGVVHTPFLNETYSALTGFGAKYNGNVIESVSDITLDKAIVSMNFSSRSDYINGMPELLYGISKKIRKIRSFGSTALDLAQLSIGRIHALIQRGIFLWDFAAAKIIMEEAGCSFYSEIIDQSCFSIVGSVCNIHNELMELIGEYRESRLVKS